MSVYGIRQRQAAYLKDRCTITRGTYPTQATVASNVPCQFRPVSSRGTQEFDVVGGDMVTLPLSNLRLLAGQDVARGDVVQVTSSADGQFTGRYFTVVATSPDSLIATRSVTVREIQT